jgi:hypothetical protein
MQQRSTRAAVPSHVLLLNTTATNLEVSVEPERSFSFMNAAKTMERFHPSDFHQSRVRSDRIFGRKITEIGSITTDGSE